MEIKKNPQKDLENKRGLFLQTGLLLSLAFVFVAFQYKTPLNSTEQLDNTLFEEVEDIEPIVMHEQPKQMLPPPVKKIELIDLIITDDDDLDVDDLDIEDSSIDENDAVKIESVVCDDEIDDEEVPFVIVEQMPIFNPRRNKSYEAGAHDLMLTMQRNARYPVIAQEANLQGRVYVRFVVTKTGEITNIEVLRSVDPILSKEAIRVVKNLPKFKPGMQRGKPVNVWFTGSINFVLQ